MNFFSFNLIPSILLLEEKKIWIQITPCYVVVLVTRNKIFSLITCSILNKKEKLKNWQTPGVGHIGCAKLLNSARQIETEQPELLILNQPEIVFSSPFHWLKFETVFVCRFDLNKFFFVLKFPISGLKFGL